MTCQSASKETSTPNRKKLEIDKLLKSKYHATHILIFTNIQLETIDKILDKAARNALGLIPNFPTKAIHLTKEMRLGYAPIRDKAT